MRVEPSVNSDDKIEILKQTSIEKKRVLQGTITMMPGHKLFKFDLDKEEITEAKFTVEKEISFMDAKKGLISQNKELDGESNCLYVSALNKKNAIKKIAKFLK